MTFPLSVQRGPLRKEVKFRAAQTSSAPIQVGRIVTFLLRNMAWSKGALAYWRSRFALCRTTCQTLYTLLIGHNSHLESCDSHIRPHDSVTTRGPGHVYVLHCDESTDDGVRLQESLVKSNLLTIDEDSAHDRPPWLHSCILTCQLACGHISLYFLDTAKCLAQTPKTACARLLMRAKTADNARQGSRRCLKLPTWAKRRRTENLRADGTSTLRANPLNRSQYDIHTLQETNIVKAHSTSPAWQIRNISITCQVREPKLLCSKINLRML